jgi:PAS domain S-box-containing protein
MRRAITKAQSRNARAFIACAFGLLLALILLAVWCGQAARLGAAAETNLEQEQVQLTNLLYLVQQAETAQRGYLLMNEDSYLAPFQAAVPQVPGVLSQLGTETDISTLRPLVEGKMQELIITVTLAKTGNRDAALAVVRTDAGLHRMSQIRAWVAAEQEDVGQRLWSIRVKDQRNAVLFVITALLCVLAAAGLGWLVMTGHQAQTHQLLDLNDELNRIFTLSADILAVVDEKGGLLSLNPAWTQVTGRRSGFRTGAVLFDIVHPDDLAAMRAAFAPRQEGEDSAPRQVEVRLRKADGGEARVAWRVVKLPESVQFYAIGRDVTHERAREDQLRQSQKMEVVGQLTGGIAHDFNNLLTIIVGSLELLQRDLAGMDHKASRRIEAALEGGRRATALTHRLLAFARRQPLAPKALEVNRLVAGMSEILHRVLDDNIELELVCAAGLWRAKADGHQLENAILNLAVNARDAMPGGGHLTIETQNAILDEDYTAAESEVRPGQYVMIAVTDTGTGMTPDVAAKVFEPFFTTKPVGHGTGLGLAQVYGFIKQSYGHVKIYSEPGEGTTVKLYLPRMQGAVAQEHAPPPEPAGEGQRRDETILVVEDEPAVRDFTAEVLREYGYSVILAENAEGALPVIESDQRVDLLFTDVVLTGPMNGRQLAEEFTARRGTAPVLFTTGYTRNAIIHNGRLDEGIAFLGKPFTATALARQVRKLLDQVNSGGGSP